MTDSKRLYVGGLFPDVKENELKERFSKFGNINKIEIKSKPSLEEGKPNTFAFIDIDISSINLVKCFSVLSNCKWKGYAIQLQVAKESFLERLKKEKDGFKTPSNTKNSNFEPIQSLKLKPRDEQSPVLKSNHRETENEKLFKLKVIKYEGEDHLLSSTSKKSLSSKPTSSSNNFTSCNLDAKQSGDVVSRLEMFSGSVWSDEKTSVGDKPTSYSKDKRYTSLANEKRLRSIKEKLDLEKSRDKLISKALKITVDAKPNKPKIAFDEEGKNVKENQNLNTKAKQKSLFNDECSDEEDLNDVFAHKPQFEGESGPQLLELQSRFGNDDRFKLDERFKETKNDSFHERDEDEESRLEKVRNLQILEAIAGKPIEPSKRVVSHGLVKRYDPTNPNCSKLEISQEKVEPAAAKVKKSTESKSKEMEVEEEKPESVSTDRFFKVDSNLANLFKKEKKSEASFSVSNLFPLVVNDNSSAKNERITKSVPKVNENKVRTAWAGNPFRYDSSDEEDEEEFVDSTKETSNQIIKRKFFFSSNDQRFKDGLSFCKTSDELIDSTKWINQKKRVTEMIKNRRKQLKRKENNKQILLKKQRKSRIQSNRKHFNKKNIKGKR